MPSELRACMRSRCSSLRNCSSNVTGSLSRDAMELIRHASLRCARLGHVAFRLVRLRMTDNPRRHGPIPTSHATVARLPATPLRRARALRLAIRAAPLPHAQLSLARLRVRAMRSRRSHPETAPIRRLACAHRSTTASATGLRPRCRREQQRIGQAGNVALLSGDGVDGRMHPDLPARAGRRDRATIAGPPGAQGPQGVGRLGVALDGAGRTLRDFAKRGQGLDGVPPRGLANRTDALRRRERRHAPMVRTASNATIRFRYEVRREALAWKRRDPLAPHPYRARATRAANWGRPRGSKPGGTRRASLRSCRRAHRTPASTGPPLLRQRRSLPARWLGRRWGRVSGVGRSWMRA